MGLRLLDRKLTAFANGEVEQSVDWLSGMIQDVSDRPALAVPNIVMTGRVQFGHSVLHSGWFWRSETIVEKLRRWHGAKRGSANSGEIVIKPD
jgi:hypothetical protein